MHTLVSRAGGRVSGVAAIATEGGPYARPEVARLAHLPLYSSR